MDYTIPEIVRRLDRVEDEITALRFVRIEDYEADQRNAEHEHLAITDRIDRNYERIEKLQFRYYVILGGLATGLVGYALSIAQGIA